MELNFSFLNNFIVFNLHLLHDSTICFVIFILTALKCMDCNLKKQVIFLVFYLFLCLLNYQFLKFFHSFHFRFSYNTLFTQFIFILKSNIRFFLCINRSYKERFPQVKFFYWLSLILIIVFCLKFVLTFKYLILNLYEINSFVVSVILNCTTLFTLFKLNFVPKIFLVSNGCIFNVNSVS